MAEAKNITEVNIKNPVKENRIGMFYISRQLLEDSPLALSKIMSEMVVCRCEMIWHKSAFQYFAYSNMFEIVGEGVCTNEYKLELSVLEKDGEKVMDIKAIKTGHVNE